MLLCTTLGTHLALTGRSLSLNGSCQLELGWGSALLDDASAEQLFGGGLGISVTGVSGCGGGDGGGAVVGESFVVIKSTASLISAHL